MKTHELVSSLKTILSLVFKILLFIAIIVIAGSHFFVDKFLFPAPRASYSNDYQYFGVESQNGNNIACRYLRNNLSDVLVLYSHGNGEDLGHIEPILKSYRKSGFSILAYDYPGYGLSTGVASEKSSYMALEAVLSFAVNKLGYPTEKVILHGRSMGAGPSIEFARRHTFRALIIESGFTSAFKSGFGIGWIPWDRFKNLEKIRHVDEPSLFIHGAKDEIVSFEQGKQLFEACNSPKFHYWVNSAGHNNLVAEMGPEYWSILNDFYEYTKPD